MLLHVTDKHITVTVTAAHFLNVALSESSVSHENVLSVIVTAASPSIKM